MFVERHHVGAIPPPSQPDGLHPLGTALGAAIGTVFGAAIAGGLVPSLVVIGCGAAVGFATGGWCGRAVSLFFDMELSEKEWHLAMERTIALGDASAPDTSHRAVPPVASGAPFLRTDAGPDDLDAARLEWDDARFTARAAWGHVTLR